jgi:hypothetical protein
MGRSGWSGRGRRAASTASCGVVAATVSFATKFSRNTNPKINSQCVEPYQPPTP